MGTMTISVEDDVEKRFREVAETIYDKRKGHLGKAVTQAMLLWTEKTSKSAEMLAVDLLNQGLDMGKIKFKRRDELHDR